MRHFLVILLLAAAIITAGCTGGDQKPAATPAPQTYRTVHVSLTPVVTATPAATASQVATPGSFVITSPVTTITDTPAQSGYQTYTNTEFKFTIQIPKSWTTEAQYATATGGGTMYEVDFVDPSQKSRQYITIKPGSSGLPLDDWANLFQNQVKNNPEVTVVSQSTIQLDGTRAQKLVLTNGVGEYAIGSTIIMVVKGDNQYFMEFSSRKNDYASYSKDADSMLGTFRFT
jgi:hypothetical protein